MSQNLISLDLSAADLSAIDSALRGDKVTDVEFYRDEMQFPALSLEHYAANVELTIGPIAKLVATLVGLLNFEKSSEPWHRRTSRETSCTSHS